MKALNENNNTVSVANSVCLYKHCKERGGGGRTNRPPPFIEGQGVKMHLLSETMLIDVCDSVTILRYGRQLS